MFAARPCRRLISPDVLRQLSRQAGQVRFPRRNVQLRFQHTETGSSSLPRLVQPSIWHSIIPKALRSRREGKVTLGEKKSTNPASYFIWIYLFIGSQAIRIIGVQNEFKIFMRKAEVKIERLREVVEKLQKGEPVDVEKALGTGDEMQEREWEDAMRELEMEDQLWQSNRHKRREEKAKREAEAQDASPVSEPSVGEPGTELPPQTPTQQTPGFY